MSRFSRTTVRPSAVPCTTACTTLDAHRLFRTDQSVGSSSVEDGKSDARHLLKRLAIGLEARGGPHTLNRHYEEVSQRSRLVGTGQLAARFG